MSSPPSEKHPPLEAYQARLAAAQRLATKLDGQAALLANVRGVLFLTAAALAGLRLFNKLPGWSGWVAGLCLALYVWVAQRHGRVLQAEQREKLRVRLNERGIARLTGKWHDFPEKGDRFQLPDHPCVPDLDVFGQGSLFQLMGELATTSGEERLAGWLSSSAPLPELLQRQAAARELTPLLDFRQGLLVEAGILARTRANPSRFIAWAEDAPSLKGLRWARPLAFLLPVATLTLYLLGRERVVDPGLFWMGLLAQLGVILATRKRLAEYFNRLIAGEEGFVRYEQAFSRVEAEPFQEPRLRQLAGQLSTKDRPPVSQTLQRLSRRFSFAELRLSGQFHAVINLLTLWDVHWMFALEGWRKQHGDQVRDWFEALAELEALCALAGLSFDRPAFVFPAVREDGPRFEAQGLGHPLLEEPVLNDVSLPGPSHALLLTGSNMSGKTTLLRAMGANTVLALAGAPVCAKALTLSPVAVLTSMRVKDSLERGVSYFYAEVQRIKKVLDAATAAQGRAMFLLDEILLGTNTRERQLASRRILKLLLQTGASGGVTTHDLSMTSLAEDPEVKVRNMHFRDHLVDGQMRFDYQLREGVVETTNALRVLAQAGIPVEDAA